MTIGEFVSKPENYYNRYTEDPIRAASLLHENAGHARMGGLYRSLRDIEKVLGGSPDEKCLIDKLCDQLCREIESEAFNNEESKELLRGMAAEYRRLHSCGMPLLTCASCGIRQFQREKSDFCRFEVESLPEWFKLSEEDNLRMDDLEKKTIDIGKMSKREGVVFEKKCAALACSVYVAKCNKTRYYLHPEFVEQSQGGKEEVTFCHQCYKTGFGKDGRAPPLSLAAGVDFGCSFRLGLETPNDHELSVLSLYRRFIKTIQFQQNGGKSTNYTGRFLRAHLVMFRHDAPFVAGEALEKQFIDAEKLKETMEVVFLGPDEKIDAMRLKAGEATHLFARPLVLHQWFSALKILNPEFRDLELPSYEDLEALVDDSVKDIIQRGDAITDEEMIRLQEELGSDVAGVRLADESRVLEELQGASVGGTRRAASTTTVTYVTNKRSERFDDGGVEDDAICLEAAQQALAKERFLRNRCHKTEEDQQDVDWGPIDEWLNGDGCFDIEIESKKRDVINSIREDDPVNEFVKDDRYITGAFPTTFLLGRAYGKGVSGIGPKERIHLLRQFSCSAARDRGLQAYLFDHQKRAESIRGVTACYRSQKGNIRKLEEILKEDGDFESRLERAIKHPAGKEAKELLRVIMPLLSFAGRNSSYGALERSAAISRIMALCQHYGPGFMFLTLASNDLNNPLSYRLTFRAKNNTDFPAVVDGEELLHCLREGTDYLGEGNIEVPCGYSERAMAAGDNPVAYIDEYRQGLIDIMTVLLGKPPSLPANDGFRGSTVRSTVYYADGQKGKDVLDNRRSKGIFGTNLSTYAVIEDHSKGTLHVHLILYGGIPARILQGAVCIPNLCQKVQECLESMITCEIPSTFHYQDAMRKVMKEFDVPDKELPKRPPAMMLRSASADSKDVSFCEAIADVGNKDAVCRATWSHCSSVQRHNHCDACKKGFFGCTGCRLCKPSNLQDKTGATWIVPVETIDALTGKITNIIPEERSLENLTVEDALPHLIGSTLSDDGVPLQKVDRKLLVYEMKRSALPPLPVVEEEGDDEHEDERSEEGMTEGRINAEKMRMEQILEEVAGNNADIALPFFKWFRQQSLPVCRRVYRYISELCLDANGYMTEYNPYLSLLTGNHTAALPLGGAEQALAAMFYLTGYVAKNKVEVERSLAILKAAKAHIDKHPSKADDSGTTTRITKHLLQRTLNRLNLMMEVSDHQIAASLLNLPTELCSDTFAYTNPKYHIALINHREKHGTISLDGLQAEMHLTDDDNGQEISEKETEFDNGSENGDGDESPDRRLFDISLYDILGPAPFYTIDDSGKKMPVPYPLHYVFRGKGLEVLNRKEYYSCVKIIKKGSKNSHLGRVCNKRFEFDRGHPLHKTHEQYLVSKQSVLVLSDLPYHPGPMPTDESNLPEWEKAAAVFAKYYLCMFRAEVFGVDYEYDWQTFVNFVESLEKSDCALSRLRLRAMETMIHSNSSSYSFKRALQLYRGKSRTHWPSEERRRLGFENYSESLEKKSDFDLLTEEEFERRHQVISRGILENLDVDIRYSDGLLREFASKCGHVPQGEKNVSHDSGVLCQRSNRASRAMQNLKDRNFGIDSALEYTPEWFRKRKKERSKLKGSQLEAVEMAQKLLEKTQKPTKVGNVMLITGPAGTGKSFVIGCIQDMALEKQRPHNSFANNAINAIHIDGSTIDSVFYPPALKKNQSEDDCHGCSPLILDKLAQLRTKLRVSEKPIVIIDEISNVSPMKLVLIDMRLKQVMANDKPFGGLAVFLVGDFKQCGPVGGTVISKAAIDVAEYDETVSKLKRNTAKKKKRKRPSKSRFSETSNYRQAAKLLCDAKWCHLKEQHRNKDEWHQALLTMFENGSCISMNDIRIHPATKDKQKKKKMHALAKEDRYKRLSENDFADKKEGWHKAPVLVSTHRERYTLTHFLALNFAAREGQRVYRWKSEYKKWIGRPAKIFKDDCVDQDPAFWEYFVVGAPVYLTDNLYKEIGLVNGTKAVFHSMIFANEEQAMQERIAIQSGEQLISLSSRPETVNIEIESPYTKRFSDALEMAKHKQWLKKFNKISLIDDRVVIPIPATRVKRNPWQNTIIRGKHGQWSPCRVHIKRHFPLMPGFAITIHKAQGMTLEKVILAIGCRPGKFNLQYNSLYVAFSRVKSANDIRLLFPIGSNWSELLYISKLRPDPSVASFFAGYSKRGGKWNKTKALQHYQRENVRRKNQGLRVVKRRLPTLSNRLKRRKTS